MENNWEKKSLWNVLFPCCKWLSFFGWCVFGKLEGKLLFDAEAPMF
jgi:hypothetical protein